MDEERTLQRWTWGLVSLWVLGCTVVTIFLQWSLWSSWRLEQETSFRQLSVAAGAILSESIETDRPLDETTQSLKDLLGISSEIRVKPGATSAAAKEKPGDSSKADSEKSKVDFGPIVWQTNESNITTLACDMRLTNPNGVTELRLAKESPTWTVPTKHVWMPMLFLTLLGSAIIITALRIPGKRVIDLCRQLLAWSEQSKEMVQAATGTHPKPPALKMHDSFLEVQSSLDKLSQTTQTRIEQFTTEISRTNRVLNNMLEGVVAVDRRMRIVIANPAAHELLNMSGPLQQGRSFLELVRIPKLSKLLEQALQQSRKLEGDLEISGQTRRHLRFRLLPLPGEQGPVGVLLTVSDETRLRRLENLRREFVANVSHELKTPLAAIKAYAETLLLGAIEDTDKNVHFVERISQQAERLDRLIQDMLQLARVQSGNLSMNLQEFPVSSALTTCVEAHAAIGASKGVTVTLLPLPDRLAIYSDFDAFQTIMNNLISNAVRYTESGGRVLVSASQSDGVVRFQVRDTGIGIPQEDQARIFERFYRVEKARTTDRGGTGLGLAIVKNLVVALGGTIRVESEVGKGSLFELQLPAPSQSA